MSNKYPIFNIKQGNGQKYFTLLLALLVVVSFFVSIAHVQPVYAQPSPTPTIPWTSNEWVPDQEVTVAGKRGERARQFINWVLDHPSIDNHPVFRQIWLISAGTALFLILIVVAFMGIGVLVARKKDVSFKVDVVPILYKTAIWLLYIVFSYLIILALIQITDVIMQFFIKILNGDQLFKIFFVSATPNQNPAEALRQSEEGYITFQGYRRIGMQFEESARSSLFLINFTSFTYFVMGIMLLLRKIVLWFLLVVAPFLAILMPFVFIRNIGWIWIGVFFQWAFYGPLFALFLGAMAKIWASGIPFAFDFTRAKQSCEPPYMAAASAACDASQRVVYPLAINILYGGPAQRAGGLGSALSESGPINTSGYIDTFAEYVIALIMLWTVIILPWWLLRIFRDYCCDGIYAMRNILMNMLNGGGIAPSPQPSPSQTRNESLRRPAVISMQEKEKIKDSIVAKVPENTSIKNVETAKLAQKLEVRVENLRDIARFETDKEKSQYYHELSGYMTNPMSAESTTDRAAFVRLKTEISQRATQGDELAQRILAATTATSVGVREHIRSLAHNRPAVTTVSQAIAKATTMKSDQVTHVLEAWVSELKNHTDYLEQIAKNTQTTASTVQNVLNALPKTAGTSNVREYVEKVSGTSSTSTSVASRIMQTAASIIDKNVVDKISKMASVTTDHVINVLEKLRETDTSTTSDIESAIVRETKESKETVQSALSALSNMSFEKSFVEKVSQSSTTTHDTVEKVLTSLPAIASSPLAQAMDAVSKNANTTQDTVSRVLKSVSSVLDSSHDIEKTLQTIAHTIGIDNKTLMQLITTANRFMSQLQSQTSSLSSTLTTQNVSEKNQKEIFSALSQFSDEHVEKSIREKDITLNKAQAIMQSIGQHITEPAQAMLSAVAKEQGITTQAVQSVSTSIFSHLHDSLKSVQSIQTQSEATKISTDTLTAVASVLSTIQNQENTNISTSVQQTATEREQTMRSMQEMVRLITSSNQSMDSLKDSTNTTHEELTQVLSQIPAIATQASTEDFVTQLSQKTNTASEIVERVLSSVMSEVEKAVVSTSLIEEIAHQTNTTQHDVSSAISTFAAMVNSTQQPLAAVVAAQTQVSQESVVPLLKAVSSVALAQQDVVEQTAHNTQTSKEIIRAVLTEALSTSATDTSESLVSRMSDKTQQSTTAVQNILKDVYTSFAEKTKTDSTLVSSVAQAAGVDMNRAQAMVNNLSTMSFASTQQPLAAVVAAQTQVSQESVVPLLKAVSSVALAQQDVVEQTAHNTQTSKEIIRAVLTEALSTSATDTSESLVSRMSDKTQQSTTAVQNILKDVYTSFAEKTKTDSTLVSSVAQAAGVDMNRAQAMVNNLSTMSFASTQQPLAAKQSNTNIEQMQRIITTLVHEMSNDKATVEKFSQQFTVAQEKVSQLMQLVPTMITQSPAQMVEHIAHETALPAQVVSQILKSMLVEVHTTAKESIIQKVSSKEHIEVEKMRDLILTVLDKKGRQKSTRMPMNMPLGAHIDVDDLISEEDSLSVDEYEEIKQMWINHYLHGEVPVSETIKTREDWVRKDMIDIENVLNKIVSEDEDVRAEGLQQVADIIPFFMLANMSVTDVAVYLKAKRAAAKEVNEMMMRESAVKERLQAQSQEEFIDVDRTQAESTPKAQEMSMNIEEDKKEKN